jgi:hypothetical protein
VEKLRKIHKFFCRCHRVDCISVFMAAAMDANSTVEGNMTELQKFLAEHAADDIQGVFGCGGAFARKKPAGTFCVLMRIQGTSMRYCRYGFATESDARAHLDTARRERMAYRAFWWRKDGRIHYVHRNHPSRVLLFDDSAAGESTATQTLWCPFRARSGVWYARGVAGVYYGRQAHRIVYERAHGKLSDIVDHIDRDGLNNCSSNLRNGDDGVNSRNRGKPVNNTSGVVGVRKHQKSWIATICGEWRYFRFSAAGEKAAFDEAVAWRRAKEIEMGVTTVGDSAFRAEASRKRLLESTGDRGASSEETAAIVKRKRRAKLERGYSVLSALSKSECQVTEERLRSATAVFPRGGNPAYIVSKNAWVVDLDFIGEPNKAKQFRSEHEARDFIVQKQLEHLAYKMFWWLEADTIVVVNYLHLDKRILLTNNEFSRNLVRTKLLLPLACGSGVFYPVYHVGDSIKRAVRLHRAVFENEHGSVPSVVDHINRNTLDARVANLRDGTNGVNQRNANTRPSSTGYVGVAWNEHEQHFCASVRQNGRPVVLVFRPRDYNNSKDMAMKAAVDWRLRKGLEVGNTNGYPGLTYGNMGCYDYDPL